VQARGVGCVNGLLKWAKWGDMMLHAPEEYHKFLTEAGYFEATISDIPEKNWITVLAKKG